MKIKFITYTVLICVCVNGLMVLSRQSSLNFEYVSNHLELEWVSGLGLESELSLTR